MCGKWNIACSFLSDVLVHLHQGLLLSSTNIDANKTAVVPDIVEMLSVADDSCTNAIGAVGYITSKPGSVACVIVNDSRLFWNLKTVNMLLYKSKSLNLNLNLIVFSMNQAIECLLWSVWISAVVMPPSSFYLFHNNRVCRYTRYRDCNHCAAGHPC